jgi:hypothetical protein
LQGCRAAAHDVRHIKTFKTTDEKTYEAWYYGKTRVKKKDLVIKCCIRKDTESIEVLASGNDPGDITGLLAEIERNLTKEFEKLGKVQPIFNIHIKDSIIQRSNLLSFCDLDGTCGGDVVIEDSLAQRSNIASWNKTEQKDEGEERKKWEEERQNEENSRIQREKESERVRIKSEEKSSGGKWFFGMIIILAVLALGYWTLATSSEPSVGVGVTVTNPLSQVDDGAGLIVEELKFLTNSPEAEYSPIWSANGSQIMYVFIRVAWNNRDSYIMNSDGSGKRRNYIGEEALVTFSDLSPNGNEIAYVQRNWDDIS